MIIRQGKYGKFPPRILHFIIILKVRRNNFVEAMHSDSKFSVPPLCGLKLLYLASTSLDLNFCYLYTCGSIVDITQPSVWYGLVGL